MKKAKLIINKRVWSGWVRWWFWPIWIVLRIIDSWKRKIVYLSQGDIFVLKREARSRYEIKVVKVHDHFIEVESLSRGLSIYRQGSFSLSELHRFKSGVLVLGKSLELVTQTMDAGAIWKLSLKKIIEE